MAIPRFKNHGLDLIALAGVVLAFGYLANKGWQNTIEAFLPNVATDLLGLWLAVRIVDRLIKKRESKDRFRRAMAESLDELLKGFKNSINYGKTSELLPRIEQLEKSLFKANKRLTHSELVSVQAVLSDAKLLLSSSDRLGGLNELASQSKEEAKKSASRWLANQKHMHAQYNQYFLVVEKTDELFSAHSPAGSLKTRFSGVVQQIDALKISAVTTFEKEWAKKLRIARPLAETAAKNLERFPPIPLELLILAEKFLAKKKQYLIAKKKSLITFSKIRARVSQVKTSLVAEIEED